jgi:hypothetical protein
MFKDSFPLHLPYAAAFAYSSLYGEFWLKHYPYHDDVPISLLPKTCAVSMIYELFLNIGNC